MNESGATERANDQPPQEKPRRRIRWYWWLGGFVVLLLVGHLIWLATLNKAIESELRAIREAGHPATADELDEWYGSVPDDENAALVLQDGFSRVHEPSDEQIKKHLPIIGEGKLPDLGKPLPAKMRSAIDQHLAGNEKALELLHKGAAMDRSRYPVDLSKGLTEISRRTQSLSPIRAGADLLALEAIQAAERGDGEQAARSIRTILGVARSLDRDPTLTSQIIRLGIQSVAGRTAEQTLNRTVFMSEKAASLGSMFAKAEKPPAITTGLIGERALAADFFSGSASSGRSPNQNNAPLRALGLAQLNRLTHFDLMREYIEVSTMPTPKRLAEYERLKRESEDLPFYASLVKMLLPSISRAGQVELPTLAQLRNARIALAIEEYRAAKGSLPESLTALTPEFIDAIPADPFTGDPLKYKKLADGYTVYSVNKDGKDDGGKERGDKDAMLQPGTDIPFTVKRRAD